MTCTRTKPAPPTPEQEWAATHGESITVSKLARMLGRSRDYVYDRLRAGDYFRLANGNVSIRSVARYECAETPKRKRRR